MGDSTRFRTGMTAAARHIFLYGQYACPMREAALLRRGVTVKASDTDHRWTRGLRFEETFGPTPFVSLGAEVDYAMSEKLSFGRLGPPRFSLKRSARAVWYSSVPWNPRPIGSSIE
ncbi:omptin family outer membrane protease [Tianweitania sp. Rool2]|uniref:Omptin family outer membrane protease n=1 Tax=Oryzicola mucosus TaxID=2767425 RepID=A0A8J6U2K3_9HYPH|nr:omptin family outer membrane protease [Oryzicola mucosus]